MTRHDDAMERAVRALQAVALDPPEDEDAMEMVKAVVAALTPPASGGRGRDEDNSSAAGAAPFVSDAALRVGLTVLADAADDVGVKFFDTDTMDPLVEKMQAATLAARALLEEAAKALDEKAQHRLAFSGESALYANAARIVRATPSPPAASPIPSTAGSPDALPPGRTKQDIANLVDLALSDAQVTVDEDVWRYDYDILVEKLRGNGLALVALSEANPWRSMESAPKDGSWMLVGASNGWAIARHTGSWDVAWSSAPMEPTHWQPLPLPPAG